MGEDMMYCNDTGKKQHEKTNHTKYETCGKRQKFTKENCCKGVEDNCHTKYATGARASGAAAALQSRSISVGGRSSRTKSTALRRKSSAKKQQRSEPPVSCKSSGSSHRRPHSLKSGPKSTSSLAQRMSRCYEIKRVAKREPCTRRPTWQHGQYTRDECGSGIVAKRYDFSPTRKLWCKTPLSMYQATIGELARKLLCREACVPRDVRGEPPSNIAEYIMPPCRGYYRKYDCLRPCEEEFAILRGGKKEYRDRVQRYWQPALSKAEKHKLDVNEYAPQNAFLTLKMRRRNIIDDALCW